ncbi:PD-(D/E)XK nuclease family protein [Peijinzhouia sedimentorum]
MRRYTMADFLEDLAKELVAAKGDQMHEVCIVFPNRRAGLFFRRHLAKLIDKPVWEPRIISFEDFVQEQSGLQVPDQLTLILELYKIFQKRLPKGSERLDRFYFWGEMLLKDFDEIDKYLVDAAHLFKILYRQKELDISFAEFSEEHQRLIKAFWEQFGEQLSTHQQKFLELWEALTAIYQDFNVTLAKAGLGYPGALIRQVVDQLESNNWDSKRSYWFAGFNALTPAEEKIIGYLLETDRARIFWDADHYYLNKDNHEAGYFLRKYRNRAPFDVTFPAHLPNRFAEGKMLHRIAVPLEVGQVKKAGELLTEICQLPDFVPERTVVVLPDERLLMPILQSLPPQIEQFNVTMGFPLKASSIHSFLEHLLIMYQFADGKDEKHHFYHQHVRSILAHPVLKGLYPSYSKEKLDGILKDNLIRIKAVELRDDQAVLKLLFAELQDEHIFEHIQDILLALYAEMNEREDYQLNQIDGECIYHFYTQIKRLQDVFVESKMKIDLNGFLMLFRQFAKSIRLPFQGEPLLGLQIMGVLETRLLDFDRIILLSMNEGVLPPASSQSSFVPYNLRKAFDMPTPEHKDAISSYHFYRLMQRANEVYAFYNTEVEGGISKGEKSRFLLQMEMEGLLKGKVFQLGNSIRLAGASVIEVPKDEQSMRVLRNYLTRGGNSASLSASALNTYLDCRLRFYFKYILKLNEVEDIQEEIDPMVFGNILHETMEDLYVEIQQRNNRPTIEREDFASLRKIYPSLLRSRFAKAFNWEINELDEKLTGNNHLAYVALDNYIANLIAFDEQQAPFTILALESGRKKDDPMPFGFAVNGKQELAYINGSIDRFDEKDGVMRVLDYKTGRADVKFTTVASLTDREDKNRNKAVFQTLIYALLIESMDTYSKEKPLQTGVITTRSLTDSIIKMSDEKDIRPNYNEVKDVREILPEFREGLQQLLADLFNPQQSWNQVEDPKKCEYCPYNVICQKA